MECYQIEEKVFKKLKKEISAENKKLLRSLQNRGEILNTIEFIKIMFSENLLEDIEFLNILSGKPVFKVRHANMILRDMLEQVIEFIFLLKHKSVISEYLGYKKDEEYEDAKEDEENSMDALVKTFRKVGSRRYKKDRAKVIKMTEAIDKGNDSFDGHSLYMLYRVLSEECHNSYFFTCLDDVGKIEEDKDALALTEEQVKVLMIIVEYFMKYYRSKFIV